MNTRPVLLVTGLVIVVCLAIVIFGLPSFVPTLPGGTSKPSGVAEVRSFQGSTLSTIGSFRENSIKGPQRVDEASYRLAVTGLVNSPGNYTYQQVLGTFPSYSRVVTLHCVEGWDVTILWEGVLVRDLIERAGPAPGANTVIFTARDGYTTSFPLAYLKDRDILMAYRMNNVTLPAERGFPFQLVAEEKWGYKWIKWIEKIELIDDPSYRGYWEQRGYSNTGNLDQGSRSP
jgi:DMSO/TMAO reductase YedYZ molybdopterin-dependent catalytic subunit